MKKVKFLSIVFFVMCVCSLSAQQTISGNLFLGEFNSVASGWGNALHFRGTAYNSDDIWMGRYAVANQKTDFRVYIGDDQDNDDRFVICNKTWNNPNVWREWFVVTNKGRVGIGGVSYPQYELEVNGTICLSLKKVDS